MTEKLKVSREVADAIEQLRIVMTNENIMWDHADTIINGSTWAKKCAPLNEISLLDMASILTNGYEVEKTPHERIAKEYIASQLDWVNNMHLHSKGFVEGIEFTLNTLGITIKGVNDK